ncbi:hypothetical protein [Henriciella litoralis]|uniref:hypothetical protein n=1 Tax=Henriciella litoralis TaxID=568102 RepID=UPI000A025330|nr:hypothetical protein [Henriciella litoralis]
MKSLKWIAALAVSFGIAACGKNEPPPLPDVAGFEGGTPEAADGMPDWAATMDSFESFADELFTVRDGREAELADIQDALPDLVSLSWDEKSFNEDNGATRLENLRITINTEPAFGLAIAEADIWGLNSDFIAARLRGERLDEQGDMFERVVARDLSYFGAADALNSLFQTLEDEIQTDDAEFAEFGVRQLDGTTERLAMSGGKLRPFEYVPLSEAQYAALDEMFNDSSDWDSDAYPEADDPMDLPAEDAVDEVAEVDEGLKTLRLAQQVIAVLRTIEIEKGAVSGTEVQFDMGSDAFSQVFYVSIDFSGYEGYRGFDIDRLVYAGIRQGQEVKVSADDDEMVAAAYPSGLNYAQVESVAFSSYEGLELDKLAGFLARSEFPGIRERDLMSLGTWSGQDYVQTINGNETFSARSLQFMGDDFVWLLPRSLEGRISGAMIHPGEYGRFVMQLIPSASDDAETEAEMKEIRENLDTAIGLLDENGLAVIPFNFRGVANWNENTGRTSFSLASEADGFGETAFTLDINLPDYGDIRAAYEADEGWSEAITPVLEDKLAFVSMRYFDRDNGGYDKLFGYLNELGKVYSNEGWGATLSTMPPKQMRANIATMVRSAKAAAKAEYPPAEAWLESIAAYYQTPGGSLEIRVKPDKPLGQAQFDAMAESEDPAAEIKRMGISVTHTPE